MNRLLKFIFISTTVFSLFINQSVAGDSMTVSPLSDQVENVFKYCSGSTLEGDRVGLIKAGFININKGVFKGELPSAHMNFIEKFYKDSGIEDFYIKQGKEGFSLIIIDGENTCNSIPLYGDDNSISLIVDKIKESKVSEHDSGSDVDKKIKSYVYKINNNVFVLSEIGKTNSDNKYKMLTAVRVYN